jgi:hypothetical protein
MRWQENRMSIITPLHHLLKHSFPGLHTLRLQAWGAAVEAGLSGASWSITALGRALSGPAFIQHTLKRLNRLAGNPHLTSERLVLEGAMAQWVLKSLPLPVIIFDGSPLTADQSQQLLRASLPVGGRSLTLYEEVHPRSKGGNPGVQKQCLVPLQERLPPHVTPIAVADYGFRTPFFREVKYLGWHWLGRIRNRDFIAFNEGADNWLAAKSRYAKATRKPTRLDIAQWVRRDPLTGPLVTFFRLPPGRPHLTLQKPTAQSRSSRKPAKREKEPRLRIASPSLNAYSAVRVVD